MARIFHGGLILIFLPAARRRNEEGHQKKIIIYFLGRALENFENLIKIRFKE
jgi:hypothetical protein